MHPVSYAIAGRTVNIPSHLAASLSPAATVINLLRWRTNDGWTDGCGEE